MSIGSNIRRIREEKGLTQENIAEMMDVSFQAVSSWERDLYHPAMDKLMRLAEILDVPVTDITDDRKQGFITKDAIYDWEHMKTFVKTTAKNKNLHDTLKALDYAVEAHKGQKRKKSEVPYIYHPLTMTCHALSMGITDDTVTAAILLHDVIEDCGKKKEELPVSEEVKEIVELLSHEKVNGSDRDKVMKAYYDKIAENPKASLAKCIDRCNNLTTMSYGLSKERAFRMINETEKYYPKLLKVIKAVPEYNNAAWLLRYHIESMLDIYKRLI